MGDHIRDLGIGAHLGVILLDDPKVLLDLVQNGEHLLTEWLPEPRKLLSTATKRGGLPPIPWRLIVYKASSKQSKLRILTVLIQQKNYSPNVVDFFKTKT